MYKHIDKSLESQHAALIKLGASLSPPQREELAASHNLSRSSPFGNLADISSRRTFAYLIATLNASHPDYDFSHVLRPSDFRRERNLRKVMTALDTTLGNVRPASLALAPGAGPSAALDAVAPDAGASSVSPLWGPQMWALLDKEMALQDSTVFSYQPADDPFEEDEPAIWAHHYLFFNKSRKRVAYLHVRGVPVVSHSPRLRGPRLDLAGAADAGPAGLSPASLKRRGLSLGAGGANKRARYWLGDAYADRLESSDDDMDDGMLWNRAGADADAGFDGEYPVYDEDEDDLYPEDPEDDDEDDEDNARDDSEDAEQAAKGPVRGVSEDIAARMEIE